MGKMKDFETLINEKLANRNTEAEDIQKRLEGLKVSLEDAENRLNDSALVGDEQGYAKAKEDISKASLSIEMNQKRLGFLKSKTALDPSEYHGWIKDVKAELEEEDRKDGAELCRLLKQIAILGAKNGERKEKANKLFHVWQYDVNLLADVPKRENKQVLEHEKVSYQNFDLNMFVEYVKGHEYFKRILQSYGDIKA